MKNNIFIALTAILIVLTFLGCKKKESPTPLIKEVWIQGGIFSPDTLIVPVNTTVKWVNQTGVSHTIIFSSFWGISETIGPFGAYSRKFTTPGNFTYTCSDHSNERVSITVQ